MKRAFTLAALCASAAIAPATIASAEPAPRNAIALELTTLQTTAITVEADHDLRWHSLSITAAAGIRSAPLGDYSAWTYGAGAELRRWRRHQMRGWYAGVHLNFAATRTTNEMESRFLGTTLTSSTGVSLGYRLLFHHAVLTPSLGADLALERAPMEPATARGALVLGLTAGIAF